MYIKILLTYLFLIIATPFIVAQNRVVLIEQFTNSGCYICANYSPGIFDYVDNNSDTVVAISYHTSFPYNDSMYHENPVESDARVNYYGVGGVPYSIVDGSYYQNSSSALLPQIATIINARKMQAPLYNIAVLNTEFANGVLGGEFVFTSNNSLNIADSLVAHIVIVEKNVLKNAYLASPGNNAETEFGYVMRKMLPNSSGTVLLNKSLNETDTVSFTTQLNSVKKWDELRMVAFVQNVNTKEVYNAFLFNPQITSIKENYNTNAAFKVYPNPFSNSFIINAKNNEKIESINIINLQGIVVYKYVSDFATSSLSLDIDIPTGIYFIEVVNNNAKFTQRIVIAK